MSIQRRAVVTSMLCLMVGCGEVGGAPLAPHAEESVYRQFALAEAARVNVDNFNGTIELRAGAEGVVSVGVVKRVTAGSANEARSHLQNIDVKMTNSDGIIRVTASRNGTTPGEYETDIVVTVPAKMNAATLKINNGAVAVSRMESGRLTAQVHNGKISVRDCKHLYAQVKATNGDVTFNRVSDVHEVVATVDNGGVEFNGTLATGDHKLSTNNGKIIIALPEDAGFDLDADAAVGSIDTEFPLGVTRNLLGASISARTLGINNPNSLPRIRVSTKTGAIIIRKAQK